MIQTEIDWLSEDWIPSNVVHHKSFRGKVELSDEGFDEYLLSTYGYKKEQRVHYSIKTGKNTIGSNPFMNEDI